MKHKSWDGLECQTRIGMWGTDRYVWGPFWLRWEPLGRRGGGPSSRGSWATEPWFHFFICPPEFFLCGNLETSLGGCAGHGGGCGVWCRGGGVLGAVEGVLGGSQWGAVGVGAGSRGGGDWWGGGGTPGGGCWGPRRGRLVGWYGAPWGWVLRAALGAVEEVSGGRGGGCWGPGGGRRRRSAGGRGGRCWEPRRGRAGAPDSEYKHPWSPPYVISNFTWLDMCCQNRHLFCNLWLDF